MRILLSVLALSMSATVMASPLDEYWQNLQSLCGQAFAGELITHPEGEDDFVGQVFSVRIKMGEYEGEKRPEVKAFLPA